MELHANRQLYASPNGDTWSTGRDDAGRVWVMHEPNMPSGGPVSFVTVETFLAQRQNYGPQHHALVALLASEGHADRQSRGSALSGAMQGKAEKALGAAVVGVWGDLPREAQVQLFEAAVITGHQMERGDGFREQLAHFLHDRHPRTAE